MENKKETKTNSKPAKTSSGRWGFQKILDFSAYIGTACIAIALILSVALKANGSLTSAFKIIGDTIAYVLAMILAGFWVKRKRHIAWLICYIIFVVIIIVMYIVNVVC